MGEGGGQGAGAREEQCLFGNCSLVRHRWRQEVRGPVQGGWAPAGQRGNEMAVGCDAKVQASRGLS